MPQRRSKKHPRRCSGRSRGGLGTKIHALANRDLANRDLTNQDLTKQDGLPVRFEPTPGQADDAPPCKQRLDSLQPGQFGLADKACDASRIREMIREQDAIDVIPPKANRKRPADFDAELYNERNRIERFPGRLKASFRRIATHHEKTDRNFLSMIKLASVRPWIKFYESAA